MAKYIGFFSWTDQGIRGVDESIHRSEELKTRFKQEFGVTIEHLYWTQGEYDLVGVLDAPDDASVSAAILRLGKAGQVRSRTVRAYEASEMREILSRLG